MAQALPTGSSQSYIMANISGSAGDTITVTDSSGNVVATTTATEEGTNNGPKRWHGRLPRWWFW